MASAGPLTKTDPRLSGTILADKPSSDTKPTNDKTIFKKFSFSTDIALNIDFLIGVFNALTEKQEAQENIENGYYKTLYFAEVVVAETGELYFIYSDATANEFNVFSRHIIVSSGGSAQDTESLRTELFDEIKKVVSSETDKRIADLTANQLNIIANKVLEVLQINQAGPINYSPTMAKVEIYKNGEPVNLDLGVNSDGTLSGEISLNGTYTFIVKG